MSVIMPIRNCALGSEDMKKYDYISNSENALRIPPPAQWYGCCGILEFLLLLLVYMYNEQ